MSESRTERVCLASRRLAVQEAHGVLSEYFFEKYAYVEDKTARRKGAREAARSVLPNATETKVFVTGNVRALRHFIEMRANPAADGALLGLWLVWRAGHKIVNFVHDQVVVEAPLDERVGERVAEIEELMTRGMGEVVPGMNVKVETVVTGSLNKGDRIKDDRIGQDTPSAMSRATMRSGPSHFRLETMATR